MDGELAALAATGATTLVGLMVSDAWGGAKARVVRFFAGDGDPDQEQVADEELEQSRQAVVAGDEEGAAGAARERVEAWLLEVLSERGAAAEELRSLLATVEPEPEPDGGRSQGDVHITLSGGEQHGPVLLGRDFSDVTFHGSSAPPPPPAPGSEEGTGRV